MRRTSRKRGVRKLVVTLVRWFTICCLIVLGVALGLMGGLFYSMSKLVPANLGSIQYQPTDATRIYSSDGVLLARLFRENRDVVKLDKIPVSLQQATVAIEDKRFYEHIGIDPWGILRAGFANLHGRRMAQGGSTITQQLARNVYLTRKKTVSRKLQELALAVAIERHYTKKQILELYLNEVYYGSGAYGVQSAAQIYFGKSVEDLTLAESALIAGLTQRPTAYSPYNNPNAARGRRRVVLKAMAEQGMISQDDAAAAAEAPLQLTSRRRAPGWKAPYFVQYVLNQLADTYGEDTVYQASLRIYTTLDYRMQEAAEEAVRSGVASNRFRGVGQGALISMDPQTGFIRAMVGGVDFKKNQFNVVAQGHPQPGSTFKPIVYTAALENGYSIRDTVVDERVWLRGKRHPPWPANYDRRYHGRVTLLTAVAQSYNVPVVKIAKAIGLDEVIKYARALGVTSPLPNDLTLALGSASLTPLEMARVYCAFANGGEAVVPTAVSRVTTGDDSAIFTASPSRARVMDESTAEGLDEMLRAVVTRGTGRSVYGRIPEARGKTGTTDELRHAWFIGYTKELVTAVWVGNDIPRPMREVYGGNVCAPMFCSFMRTSVPLQKAYNSKRSSPEPQTRQARRPRERRQTHQEASDSITLTICDSSGLKARSICPSTHEENFRREDAPSAYCDIHTQVDEEPTGEYAPEPGAPETPAGSGTPRASTTQPTSDTSERYVSMLVCADTGQQANTNCPHVVRRRFREDLAPTSLCSKH